MHILISPINNIRSFIAFGAFFGAAWYVIYDKIFCPHG
jgi:hypothetical protein